MLGKWLIGYQRAQENKNCFADHFVLSLITVSVAVTVTRRCERGFGVFIKPTT